jgi:hypothetical protein
MDYGPVRGTKSNQTTNALRFSIGVRLRVLRFVVERETAQNVS